MSKKAKARLRGQRQPGRGITQPNIHLFGNVCSGMVKKVCSWLRELVPAARASQPGSTFLSNPVASTDKMFAKT